MKDKYITKGKIYFKHNQGDLDYLIVDHSEYISDISKEDNVYDLMEGVVFYSHVDCGGIINYDGTLSGIYIDGYRSNLGLSHKGLSQGQFMVDGETFLDICKEHKVEVNWANK